MNSSGNEEALAPAIQGALEEWKSLTLAETEAIHARDWKGLEGLQSRKTALQTIIGELEARFHNSKSLNPIKKAHQKETFRQIVLGLSELEAKNRDLLADLMTDADTDLKDSNRAIHSLRHVQKAYGSSGRSFWQAYS